MSGLLKLLTSNLNIKIPEYFPGFLYINFLDMKNKILIVLLLLLWQSILFAQDYTKIEFTNLDNEVARNAVNQAFKDLKLPKMYLWKNQMSAESALYTYTSLMVKNRFVFSVVLEYNTLTVAIVKRQYFINNHWEDNPLPMSKKQAAKILDPLKEKINDLVKTNTTNIIAKSNIENKETLQNKTGIYEDFVIVKTDDPEMELLTMHENGNIIGFYLFDDKITVKGMVYKESKDSEAISMEFDKEGLPIAMGIKDLSFQITSTNDGDLVFKLKDKDGNFIGEEKIAAKSNFNTIKSDFFEDSNNHGPNASYNFQPLFTNTTDALSDELGNA